MTGIQLNLCWSQARVGILAITTDLVITTLGLIEWTSFTNHMKYYFQLYGFFKKIKKGKRLVLPCVAMALKNKFFNGACECLKAE